MGDRPVTIRSQTVNDASIANQEISRRMIALYRAVHRDLPEGERCGEPWSHEGIRLIEDLHRAARTWRVWGYRNVDDPDDEPVFEGIVDQDGLAKTVGRGDALTGAVYAKYKVELITHPLPYGEDDDG